MQKVVKHRLDVWKEEPSYWTHMSAIEKRIYASSIPRTLIELIKIRASQINKCAYCIDYHTTEALQIGETTRRIFALAAWKESPLFTETERNVLQLTEEMTHISIDGVADETYEHVKAHFTTAEIADIMICISHINFLNRIGISTKTVAL
ncbi:alkylhydroperoxidase AhpD family core domain-containing protein [Dyadobacter soli]|uniref:Alkylhydroperoxidase AhpD family core domain-containing protein n=1 Tax=Dyadobacter soli TaxID=659014 RepID=A0A1G7FVV9_9BACT|nr:carboxymuconolactone decarboxylase family protein [Dyadobacter soli]SDE80014.1 alkylhydroperoxidase AhpD family core domain-containing protein [Dyadobacter soli]